MDREKERETCVWGSGLHTRTRQDDVEVSPTQSRITKYTKYSKIKHLSCSLHAAVRVWTFGFWGVSDFGFSVEDL